MNLFARIRNVVVANAHHAVDQAENPHVMANQVLRDLGEEVQATRRSRVAALGAERHLLRQRDQFESSKLINKLAEARTEKLLKEYAQERP